MYPRQSSVPFALAIAALSLSGSAVTAATTSLPLTPQCGQADGAFEFKAGKCEVKAAVTKALDALKVSGAALSKETCEAANGIWNAASSTCSAPAAPEPSCLGGARVKYDKTSQICTLDTSIAASEKGNYVSDCLVQRAAQIPGAPSDEYLYVLSQSDDGTSLDVIPGAKSSGILNLTCGPKNQTGEPRPTPKTIATADVKKYGALRRGLVYGAMVSPYKYYPKSGEVDTSAPTLMPYFGRRVDYFGGTIYTVVSAGISKAALVDDTDKTTSKGTASVLNFAGGLVFELNKGQSPFRWGILWGRDLRGSSSASGTTLKYEGSWLALQLGFDFVD